MSKLTSLPEFQYISTRGSAPALNFEETILTGLASDGGLYLPQHWPRWEEEEFTKLCGRPYEEIVLKVLMPFVGSAFSEEELNRLITDAYSTFRHPARCPLIQLAPNLHLLELFHGPTLAFKDFALQLVGRMFATILARQSRRVTIIGATSGDTGSAAIEAFRGLDSADIFIFFPKGRVSDIQRRQMTTPTEPNVHAIAVEGDFDDCQSRVKDLFNDEDFRQRFQLGAVNSINWARIAVQVAYFVAAALTLGAPQRKISFVVPTGNFGDIFAGYVAKRMGLAIDRLVVATNQNDILHRSLLSGECRAGEEVLTSISPSMDIQVSSNFERALFEASGQDSEQVLTLMNELRFQGGFSVPAKTLENLRQHYVSGSSTEGETRHCIRQVWQQTGQLVCPHTAVGIKVAKTFADVSGPIIALATAHPAKFPEAVKQTTGIDPPLPEDIEERLSHSERMTTVGNDLSQIKQLIGERVTSL